MTLSDVSIKNPVFAWMLMAGLIVFGAIGFSRMGVSQLPDVDYPMVSVGVTWEGAAPEVMETEVTDVIEDVVMGVQGIREVTSTSRQGSSRVSIEFELGRDIDVCLQEVQAKLSHAVHNLPRDIDAPVVSKSNPEDQPIIWLAVSGDRPFREMTEYVKLHIKDRLTTVSGVGEIFMGGFLEPSLRVWLDAKRMERSELTVEDVLGAIEAGHAEVPAGYLDTGVKEMNIRVMGEASTPEAFSRIIIPSRRGAPIWREFRIGDVAQVEDGLEDARRIARSQGRRTVALGIVKQRGSNAVEVSRVVTSRAEELKRGLPSDMRLEVVFDTTQFIRAAIRELTFNLVLAGLLTSLVCFLFLGSWSATLNVLLAIPTAIVGTFIALYFFGFTLNTFTMLGLSLVIGIVVDDAIMVLENISRYREAGLPRVRAAIVGAREITFAALAASVAILAIFIPVIFMRGIIGKFFFQFGITISVAVLLSLVEALTIAPMRCAQFLELQSGTWVSRGKDRVLKALADGYRALLARCLGHPWLVLLAAALFFGGSLLSARTLKSEFVPAQDQGRLMVRIIAPLGSSLDFTDGVVRKAEAIVAKHPDVQAYLANVGGMGGSQVNQGMLNVTMKPKKERPPAGPGGRPRTQQQLMNVLRQELKDIPGVERVSLQDLSLMGLTAQRGFPIEFTVLGPDWDKLASLSAELMTRMKDSGLMTDVDTDYQLGMPELKVLPDRSKAAARGVSVRAIGDTVNAMMGGLRAGKFTRGGRRYDVRVRLVDADRRSPKDISRIWVRNNRGEVIRLSDVTSIDEKPTLLSITRKNRQRAVRIFANPAPGKTQGEALAALEKIGQDLLPEGYSLAFSGTSRTYRESFQGLLFALLLGILVAYMVLGTQFNSYLHPFIVLLALPFSASGAFFALQARHLTLNIYSFIGIVLLMGIVKKNSILLVDFTNHRRRQGLGVREALLEACPIRLRPILMTSTSTIAGAIPLAFAIGPGAESMIPMAVVVVGGVAVSTCLTLVVVPCAYLALSRFESRRHEENLKEALRELGELPKA